MDAMKIAEMIVRIGGSGMDIGISREELKRRVIEIIRSDEAITTNGLREKFADAFLSPDQFRDMIETLRSAGVLVLDDVDLFEKYKSVLIDRGLLELSLRNVFTNLNRCRTFIIKKYGVDISTENIQHVRGYMLSAYDEDNRSRGLKITTRQTIINNLRPYFHWVYNLEYTSRDVGDVLPTLKNRDFDPNHLLDNGEGDDKVYSDSDIENMINIALAQKNPVKAARDAAIIATLAASGLRSGELRSIPYSEIHKMQDDGIIVVRRKGGKYEKVAIAKFAHRFIRRYQSLRPITRYDKPFFLNLTSEEGISDLNQLLKPIQESAGVRIGIHNFRHTVITNIARANDSGVAAMIAGHTTDSVTRKHYIHPSDADKISVINQLPYAGLKTRDEMISEIFSLPEDGKQNDHADDDIPDILNNPDLDDDDDDDIFANSDFMRYLESLDIDDDDDDVEPY